jgi:hypothetical protein
MKMLPLLLIVPSLAAAQTGTNSPADPLAALAGMFQSLQQSQDSTDPGEAGPAAQFLQALQGGENPLGALGGQPPVNFRELRELLPEELAGLKRTEIGGQKTGMLGANISEAEAKYGQPGGPAIEVKITDLAAMGAFGAMAGFGWAAGEIDRESDRGYERTTEFKGHKGLEKYDTTARRGNASVMVANRFMIEIESRDIDPAQLRTAAEALDYDALDRLAKRPVIE